MRFGKKTYFAMRFRSQHRPCPFVIHLNAGLVQLLFFIEGDFPTSVIPAAAGIETILNFGFVRFTLFRLQTTAPLSGIETEQTGPAHLSVWTSADHSTAERD